LLFPRAECGAVEETPHLSELERDCLVRYLSVVREELGEELVAVWLFGSAARGNAWWSGMPIRSDVDLLVVTRSPLAEERREELVNATYPLFLECGRQIGPQFRTEPELEVEPPTPFLENLRRDGIPLWRAAET
jgi:predicted nucleotidyltransferase